MESRVAFAKHSICTTKYLFLLTVWCSLACGLWKAWICVTSSQFWEKPAHSSLVLLHLRQQQTRPHADMVELQDHCSLNWWALDIWTLAPICAWYLPGKNTGVGCHFLLQGIFLREGSNPWFLHWKADSLPLSHQGSPSYKIWINCWKRTEGFERSVQFSSVVQSCPSLCDPMDCSMPGFLVHHQLPELAQTHVHWIGDAIQPSHSLSSPSPSCLQSFPASASFLVSQSSHQVAKYWSFRFIISPSNRRINSLQWLFVIK